MNGRIFMLKGPTNPLLQLVYFVVGGIVLIGAVLMGAVILAFVFGFALVAGLVIWIRLWFLRRAMAKRAGGASGAPGGRPPGQTGDFIEVEYTVVDERDPPEKRN
jgi:hypothetical protein